MIKPQPICSPEAFTNLAIYSLGVTLFPEDAVKGSDTVKTSIHRYARNTFIFFFPFLNYVNRL
jgi:hypothetical protein